MLAKLTSYIHLLRLDKPIGIWLLFFPAGIAACMAHTGAPDLWLLALLLLGAVITRSAGCIINDLTDRELDAKVARTKTRPLASGAIGVPQALALLFLLGIAALAVVAFLPPLVLYIALLAVPMIATYPWMKRITWWPQLFLGFTFNLGVWMGWAATGMPFTMATVLLYVGFILWTLGYDTVYALQDMADDRHAGIKSTALKLGKRTARYVSGWYMLMLLCLLFAGALADTGPLYLVGIVLVALQMRWQMRRLQSDDSTRMGGTIFRSNQWLGLALFLGILLDRMLGAGSLFATLLH